MSMLVKPVQTYVINLDRSTERMAHMAEVLSAYGLEFIRIPAVEANIIDPRGDMLNTEVACFLSHIKVWETFLASVYDYALVLEDDIIMADSFAKTLRDMRCWPKGFDVVKVETAEVCGRRVRVSLPKIADICGRKIYRLISNHEGSAGYILSRDGAQKLMALSKYFTVPVDMFLFCDNEPRILKVMQMVPAPIRQFSLHGGEKSAIFKSTITPERTLRPERVVSPNKSVLAYIKYAVEYPLARLGRKSGVKIEVPFG